MAQLVAQLLGTLATVPVPLIYVLSAIWVGAESLGIGVPIEPVMLFVGSLVATGHVNLALAVACLAVGCLVCAGIAFCIGRTVGTVAITRVGRYIGLTPARADHLELWLRHRGVAGVFLTRLTPMVRTFGSYIMGAADLPPVSFALATLAGSLVYCGAWVIVGDMLGANYAAPLAYLDRLGGPGVAVVAGGIVLVVVLHHFWGRMLRYRITRHFERHQACLAEPVAAAQRGATTGTGG